MKTNLPGLTARIMMLSALVIGVLAAAGCVYQLGSSLPPNLQTIYLPMFVNKCGEPQVENDTTRAAIQEFQKDGTLRVVPSAAEADLVLEVTLNRYKLTPLRYERDQSRTTREYRLRIGADVVVRKTKPAGILTRASVEGETTFLVAGDLTNSKRTALPAAALDLAHRIVETVTEAW